MSQELKPSIADIKPGHPIWEDVWAKSRPDGTSHLNQLFEAKLELAHLQRSHDAAESRIDELKQAIKILLAACISDNGLLKAPTVAAERLARAALTEAAAQKENGNG